MSGWPWPLDGVQAWFEDLWNNVLSAPFNAANYILNQLSYSFQNIIDYISSNIGYIINNVTSAVNNFTNYIYMQLNHLYTNISNFINNVISSLRYTITNLYNNITNIINNGLSGLRYFVQNVYTNISNFIQSSFKNMEYFLNNLSKNIFNTLNNIHKFIAANINYLNNQLSNTAQFLNNSINNGINAVNNTLNSITTNISQQLSNIFKQFPIDLEKLLKNILNIYIADPGKQVLPQVTSGLNNILPGIQSTISMLFTSHSPLTPEEANKLVGSYLENMDHYFGALAGILIAAEILTLGQIDFSLSAVMSHPLVSGAKSIADRMHTAWFDILYTPLLRRYFYKNETPLIPSAGTLLDMYWRGLISEDALYNYLAENGYSREWGEKLLQLSKNIPGPQDLITFVVREVIKPEDFREWMKKKGYEEFWSNYYWEAHWRLPSFENLREAWWRGIISRDEFRKYIVWHDYKPEPRPGISKSDVDIINALSYELPGRIDTRWMYDWGIINKDDLKNLLKMQGIHPDWLDKVAEAEAINILRDEVGRIRSVLERLYEKGYISRDQLEKELKDLHFREEVINLTLKWADLSLEEEVKDTLMDIYEEAYEKGQISETELKEAIDELIVDPKLRTLKYNLIVLKKMPKPKKPKEILQR